MFCLLSNICSVSIFNGKKWPWSFFPGWKLPVVNRIFRPSKSGTAVFALLSYLRLGSLLRLKMYEASDNNLQQKIMQFKHEKLQVRHLLPHPFLMMACDCQNLEQQQKGICWCLLDFYQASHSITGMLQVPCGDHPRSVDSRNHCTAGVVAVVKLETQRAWQTFAARTSFGTDRTLKTGPLVTLGLISLSFVRMSCPSHRVACFRFWRENFPSFHFPCLPSGWWHGPSEVDWTSKSSSVIWNTETHVVSTLWTTIEIT